MLEETDSFIAVAEDGSTCTIIELTKMIAHRALSGTKMIPGAREYQTSSGRHINPLGGDVFEDVLTNKRYTRQPD
ncbi:hypothetical protein [Massilia sp. Leaf139]|uniref:hypothetical protein n=1 Tax=Massilia sp. Leaf139 TaxID=1736272 RepID=UPI000700F071|nr:hypothetical protein [Massilia sp. Leaf139]KQQ94974.1 hypothetical protein ASF77_22255 [Massilia sp. Leaf139]